MELDIYAGKRVLYKKNGSNWHIGELGAGHACINKDGLYLPIFDKDEFDRLHSKEWDWEEPEKVLTNINDIFLDAQPVEEYWKQYKDIFITKEEYVNFIEQEDFVRAAERAYVSDGEYYYYPISKFTRNWLEKQPFEYIVRIV